MKRYIVALLSAVTLSLTALPVAPTPAAAIDLLGGCSKGGVDCKVVKQNTLSTDSNNQVWKILMVVLQILGGVAVIMIVIGGIRYSLSSGDASKVKSAKDTILYAVIGLVVALLAGVIVALVNNFFG